MKEVPVVQYIEYAKVDNFLQDISYGGNLFNQFMHGDFVYRGHASNKYKLIPTALRPESSKRLNEFALWGNDEKSQDLEYFQILKENHILRDFYKICDRHGLVIENIDRIRNTFLDKIDLQTMVTSEFWLPKELWALASLAQHYGLPTRLLDWTHDIFIALFFAVEDYLEGREIPENTEHIVLWALNLKLLTIPNELDFPLKLVQPIYHGNENLKAQQGLFTLWQVEKKIDFINGSKVVDMKTKVNRTPLDQLLLNLRIKQDKIDNPYLYGFMLPLDSAKDIYRYIKSIGYDASRIYPGYNGVVKSLLHDYFLNSENISKGSSIVIVR